MAKYIDLNCDMGESYGRWTLGADEEIMPHITSANVACGFHGGDPHVMRKTVALALQHKVAIGSHPSLPDLIGFGRRVMDVTPAELKDYLCYQTGALREYCRAAGTELQHMKPHGILYTMIEKQPDQSWSTAIGEASKESGKELILMALASGHYDRTVRKMGVRTASEGFADRAYNVDLSLVSRKLPARSSPIPGGRPSRRCGWRWRARSRRSTGWTWTSPCRRSAVTGIPRVHSTSCAPSARRSTGPAARSSPSATGCRRPEARREESTTRARRRAARPAPAGRGASTR
jgi:UPF0271 protein